MESDASILSARNSIGSTILFVSKCELIELITNRITHNNTTTGNELIIMLVMLLTSLDTLNTYPLSSSTA